MKKKILLTTILLPLTVISLLLSQHAEAKYPVIHYSDTHDCYIKSTLDESVDAINQQYPPRNVSVEWLDRSPYHLPKRAQRPQFSVESIFNGGLFNADLMNKVAERANPLSIWENIDQTLLTPYQNLMGHTNTGQGSQPKKSVFQRSHSTNNHGSEDKSSSTKHSQQEIRDFSMNASVGMINSLVGLINPFELIDQS